MYCYHEDIVYYWDLDPGGAASDDCPAPNSAPPSWTSHLPQGARSNGAIAFVDGDVREQHMSFWCVVKIH
jgi:hypothetical protein